MWLKSAFRIWRWSWQVFPDSIGPKKEIKPAAFRGECGRLILAELVFFCDTHRLQQRQTKADRRRQAGTLTGADVFLLVLPALKKGAFALCGLFAASWRLRGCGIGHRPVDQIAAGIRGGDAPPVRRIAMGYHPLCKRMRAVEGIWIRTNPADGKMLLLL